MTKDAFRNDLQPDQGGIAPTTRELERQRAEILALQDTIHALQAEINGMKNSLSWRITQPLRGLARHFPRAASLGQRSLDRLRDALVSGLPKQTVQFLFDNRWQLAEDVEEQISAYRASSPAGGRKIVFYTAIFGEYDNLLLPERIDPDIDYICFTDRPRNTYGVWQMRLSPYYHPDPTRVARWVKTHPHELFPDHDVAIWLDANIILKGDIHRYIDMVKHDGTHLGLISHPHRSCFYDEAEACKRLRKDSSKAITTQVEHYRKHGLPRNQPLFETGFMVVPLRNRETAKALHCWWQQVEQFSRRDQLGLAWVIYQFPKLQITPLMRQGASVRDHEDFRYFGHNHAHALIVPDKLLGLGSVTNPADGKSFSDVKDQRLPPLMDTPIDIIVCVYNALEDVRLCLEAAWRNLLPEHRIIIVNDLSDDETSSYLREFAKRDRIVLIENQENLGYTRSANRGLAASSADFRILLNSDTIVSPNWALKMLDAANQSESIGIVGPLSNAAGAQSIPQIKDTNNNTTINALPEGLGLENLDLACETWSSADVVPRVPLVHGFCFGVKKAVVDQIGFFDDENFKRFYGEENDYCFRALAAGFQLAIATNTFVFHRKSRSIEEEKRVVHMAEAWRRLREIYGADKILAAYKQVEDHPILDHMRIRAGQYLKQGDWKERFSS